MQTIREVMTTNVPTISPDATIEKAAQEMRAGDLGVIAVEDENRLLGVITDRDIVVRAVATGKSLSTPVRDILSGGVACVRDSVAIEEGEQIVTIMRTVNDHQIRHLPVVDVNQRLVGIVALGEKR